ncbi:MAG: hypothetical protein IID44_16445 [Planctomycetes bacterium]|nr:hypothetical protein [Planctomycetota bacterium]
MSQSSNSKHSHANHFVADGHARACAAAETQVRAAVTAEYAERLKAASLLGRIRLRRDMEREIQRRISEQAPPWALY